MLEIHLFGKLRRFASDPRPEAESVILMEEREHENLQALIDRIGISPSELGELFIDGTVATLDDPVPANARVGIFPVGMYLLCGGQHLKGHGFITKSPKERQNYYR